MAKLLLFNFAAPVRAVAQRESESGQLNNPFPMIVTAPVSFTWNCRANGVIGAANAVGGCGA